MPEKLFLQTTCRASLPATVIVEVEAMAAAGCTDQVTSWSEVKVEVTNPLAGIGQRGKSDAKILGKASCGFIVMVRQTQPNSSSIRSPLVSVEPSQAIGRTQTSNCP